MQTLSLISPKSMLTRIADMFQRNNPIAAQPTEEVYPYSENKTVAKESRGETLATPKTKLNVTVDDLKVISTALLHYKRNLAKIGESKKAENVGAIDKKFYDLILQLSE